jgi:ABC-type cobalamin/Fe3+-siderophores transport systems, ATPase components
MMGRYSRIPVGRGVKEKDRKIVTECLENVEIRHLKDRPFRSLSGGEKQRALLARALAGEPDILILDEPTTSMDIKGETVIMELIGKVKEKNELTVLMVSHFLNTVARFADHVIIIDKDNDTFSAGDIGRVLDNEALSRIFGLNITLEHVSGGMQVYEMVK